MIPDKSPLLFEPRLGGLFPANKAAEEALQGLKGRVRAELRGGVANERRRSLYWSVAALVTPVLNDLYTLTLTENDLHDITRDKLGLVEEVTLPSGDIHKRRKSTAARAMIEAERAEYTDKALRLWSTWTGVDATTLKREAENG